MRIREIKNFLKNYNAEEKINDTNYKFEDFIEFLMNSLSDEIPLICYERNIYMHSLIVPKENLNDIETNKLLSWNFYRTGYGYAHKNGEYSLTNPCDDYNPNDILKNAIPPFIERDIFEGTDSEIDINQQISNRLDIAKINDENIFYKLDNNFEFEEVAKIDRDDEITICTLNRTELDKYLTISNSVLIRFFDILLVKDIQFGEKIQDTIKISESDIYYNYITDDVSSKKEIRGFQIIDYEKKYDEFEEDMKNYQTFIIQDYNTKDIIEHDSNPKNLSNNFNKINGPSELSLAFFKPDVLRDYKGDSEKYQISVRKISKGNYWNLYYSMSDDESQIIVYLIDLGNLPEKEQLHWKRFNEKPKSEISDFVYKRDILVEWVEEENTLEDLKILLKNFPTCNIDGEELDIWEEKNKNNIRKLNNLQYVRYGSKDEWEKETDKLCQIIVEGLNYKTITKIAEKLNFEDEELRSIKLLKKCLEILNFEDNIINLIINPLEKLNYKRISIDHSKNHDIYPQDTIKDFAKQIDEIYCSFKKLVEIIDSGKFNF